MALHRLMLSARYKILTKPIRQIGCNAKEKDKMPRTRNLTKCTTEQVESFLDSFDVVLSDCDGVLWHMEKPIEGAIDSLKRLQSLGKRVYLVSNNSTMSINGYREKLLKFGFEVYPDQIISISKVIAWYLNKINFREEAFVIASRAFRDVLTNAGIKLASNPEVVETDRVATIKAVVDRPSVKAVIVDFHIDCDWAKLTFAISCLQRKDVLYLCGAQDEWVVHEMGKKILGPGPLIKVITNQSGREPIECAKPSLVLKDYIMAMCNLQNPGRCLFVGDTINYDMKFGAMCGFLKLFVSTGLDTLEKAETDEETCPEFYIPSLGQLHPILNDLSCLRERNKKS